MSPTPFTVSTCIFSEISASKSKFALLEQNPFLRKYYLNIFYAKSVLLPVTCDWVFKTWLKSSKLVTCMAPESSSRNGGSYLHRHQSTFCVRALVSLSV